MAPGKKPNIIFIFLSMVFVISASQLNQAFASPCQDYEVYIEDLYLVRGQVDGKIVYSSEKADDAIQFAIDKLAGQGGEVLLHRGTFLLENPVQLKNNLVLRGKSRGTQLLVSSENESGIGILCKDIKGSQVVGLSVRPVEDGAGMAGIVIDNSGDCRIRDVHCQAFGSYGIMLINNSFLCEVTGCQLVDNRKSNLFLENLREKGRGGDFLPNMVTNLTIYGGGNGIECIYAIVVNINNCQIFQTKGHGIYIHSTSNSVLITGCRTFQIETDAIVVMDSHEINISSNIFCWHRGNGIVLDNVTWGTISANNIIDSGVRAGDGEYRNGIVLSNETRSIQVSGNAIFNWGDQVPMKHGIFEKDRCRMNSITNNTINYYNGEAVLSKGKGTLVNNNQGKGPDAWIGMDREPWPDFSRTPIEAFIDSN